MVDVYRCAAREPYSADSDHKQLKRQDTRRLAERYVALVLLC